MDAYVHFWIAIGFYYYYYILHFLGKNCGMLLVYANLFTPLDVNCVVTEQRKWNQNIHDRKEGRCHWMKDW